MRNLSMAGIYLHIPFCKKACHYCNFHFSTSLGRKDEMLEAILRELDLRQDYLQGAALESIYFGGGTPSLLSAAELERFFEHIYRQHRVLPGAEITLEANPDDLSKETLQALRQTPVNRLSIGVQSFFDADLSFMNRAHGAAQAIHCLEDALSAGFQDLSVDLIYGAPTTSDAHWAYNIQTLLDFGVPHISAYCLTVEERTALWHFVQKGKAPAIDEEQAARQFEYLIHALAAAGYEHYEISNFAQPGRYARHNTSYWLGTPYLGVGPSAHSFNGSSRQWNIANNAAYLRLLGQEGETWYESETLSPEQRYRELVMTGLRTMWGFDPKTVEPIYRERFLQLAQPLLEKGLLRHTNDGHYTISPSGKLLADWITVELL